MQKQFLSSPKIVSEIAIQKAQDSLMNKLSNDHFQFQFEDEFRHSDVPVDLSEIKKIVRRTRDQERRRSVWLVDKELRNARHALDRAVESGEEKDVVFGCMCWVQACETMLKKIRNQLGCHER